MIKVTVLGAGNVATHLIKAFLQSKNIKLIQVYNRTLQAISYLSDTINTTDNLNDLIPVDVTVVCVSDDAIASFSKNLNSNSGLVVHTSGSVSMNKLTGNYSKGVFYPLQTFSKSSSIIFNKIPICIETENDSDLILLEKMASAVSQNIYVIDSEQRKKLHLAAVFVNNFVNHLYQIGNTICDDNNVPFEILHPLIKETAKKVKKISPYKAQTGPAKRNDISTIENQMAQLNTNQQELYTVLSNSILKTYK